MERRLLDRYDQPYTVILQGFSNDENGVPMLGDFSEPTAVTPKADPDMPSGAMLIDDGAQEASSRQVVLNLSATDTPLDGAAQGSAAHMTDQYSQLYNTVSGGVQVRISNDASMAGAAWQPLVSELPWTLACANGQTCIVYAQFKDAANNESLIVNDSIVLNEQTLFLPLINR